MIKTSPCYKSKWNSSIEISSINLSKKEQISKDLIKWGKRNYARFPWRSTENKFHALIVETMLQRTRAEQVVEVYRMFTTRYPSPEEAVLDEPDRILRLLEPLGLRWRSRKILELICELNRLGSIPERFHDLIELPGIGPYAASAYLSFHLGVRAPITDSNAVRLWSRIFGFKRDEETRRKKKFLILAEKMTPSKKFKAFNYAVLDLTRTICKSKPLCHKCPITSYCTYFKQNVEKKHVS